MTDFDWSLWFKTKSVVIYRRESDRWSIRWGLALTGREVCFVTCGAGADGGAGCGGDSGGLWTAGIGRAGVWRGEAVQQHGGRLGGEVTGVEISGGV